ncbi:hypothetical protein KP509_22G077000 [Ceratopteris richardii]|uniref:Ionotropic glutamate receptor C-terminal domain-containing protein n=1 Tax=Ceratopteris richardii TaxID=49495 RepID=A0A8T2S9S5_CERRI|nr:hypothetical protein KP509_22G077000 [Ceratopteris richardii]KAH7307770.1 hypothetical protein KP509_22G077000 [Ceratopteris richardii]
MASRASVCSSPIFIMFIFSGLQLFMAEAEEGSSSLVSRNGALLKVLVPAKGLFNEFIRCDHRTNPPIVDGFCKDVFIHALPILSPKPSWTDVEYKCYDIEGNTEDEKDYTALVRQLTNKTEQYDAVIGDVTIASARLEFGNFTQTYLDSGIVIVTLDDGFSRKWFGLFFEPFDLGTWFILVGSILAAGFTLWLLEDKSRMQQHSYQSTTSRFTHFSRTFWFLTLILVLFRRDCIKNPLSKFVMMAWIIFILLVSASYTASLSSILTVNKRSPKHLEIQDLRNKKVGYQDGSIVREYLRNNHITDLCPLKSVSAYGESLRKKKVSAIVDEIPCISLFLAEEQSASKCDFSVSKKLTIEGLGFAFYNGSLADAFSTSILGLSENGELQNLAKGRRLTNVECPTTIQSTQLNLRTSRVLFIIMVVALSLVVVFLLIRGVYDWLRRRQRYDGIDDYSDDPSARGSTRRRNSFLRLGLHPSEMG